MKQKIIVACISSFFAIFCAAAQSQKSKNDNILIKEIPSGQALLMLQVRYKNDREMATTYAEPLLFMENKLKVTLPVLELSLENCCSNQPFQLRHLGGVDPTPYWNERKLETMNGQFIFFPGKITHEQIKSNDKVSVSCFNVIAANGSGTMVIVLIGPLEELKNTYLIQLGQVFDWKFAKREFK